MYGGCILHRFVSHMHTHIWCLSLEISVSFICVARSSYDPLRWLLACLSQLTAVQSLQYAFCFAVMTGQQ